MRNGPTDIPSSPTDGSTQVATIDSAPVEESFDRLATFRELVKRIRLNEYGMPVYLFRSDLIPANIEVLDFDQQEAILHESTIRIRYDEGFPAFDDGSPIWGPIPFESDMAYAAFQTYLGLADSHGVRRIDLCFDEIAGVSHQELLEYHTYYYWSLRSRAHDLFEIAAAQKMRERRILKTTDRHFLEAEKLLGKVLGWFGKTDEDGNALWEKDLTPKTAMDMFDKLSKIQRVSLGLPAHGLAAGEDTGVPKNASFELALRTIAQKSGDLLQKTSKNNLEMLLSDPDAAMMAQELILKVNSNGKERTISEITDSSMSLQDEIGG